MEIRLGETTAASIVGLAQEATQNGNTPQSPGSQTSYLQSSIESGIVSGFQLATANGPLCDEPMWGVIFEVHLADWLRLELYTCRILHMAERWI